jgi:hypothetical protein
LIPQTNSRQTPEADRRLVFEWTASPVRTKIAPETRYENWMSKVLFGMVRFKNLSCFVGS